MRTSNLRARDRNCSATLCLGSSLKDRLAQLLRRRDNGGAADGRFVLVHPGRCRLESCLYIVDQLAGEPGEAAVDVREDDPKQRQVRIPTVIATDWMSRRALFSP